MAETAESQKPTTGRRDLLKATAAVAGSSLLGFLLRKLPKTTLPPSVPTPLPSEQPKLHIPPKAPTPQTTINETIGAAAPTPITTLPKPALPEAKPTPDIPAHKKFLNEITPLPIESPERIAKEKQYAETAHSLEEIDAGIWIIQDPSLKEILLRKRYALRETGTYGLRKPEEPYLKWCKENDIHPETLAQALNAYEIAGKLFDPQKMINPGGMAALVASETAWAVQFYFEKDSASIVSLGFGYTGDQKVMKTLDRLEKNPLPGVDAKEEREAIIELCKLLSADTKVNFNPNQIIGSTAGAIGLQFMPSKALEVYKGLKKLGYSYNPFDVSSSLVGAWYFLIKKEYQRGDEAKIMEALNSWNPHPEQKATIYKKAGDFYNKFPKYR